MGEDIKDIYKILKRTYDGKPVFSVTTLFNYLHRLDMNEAIPENEAFVLLDDYLRMCETLGIQPRIDGDSLKREHDVTARNMRNKRDEALNQKLASMQEYLHRYDYENGDYLIRGVYDYDDMLDEHNQMHNCVASYGKDVSEKRSNIYFMRKKSEPDTSLITVELSMDESFIRQKYLSYNRPITDLRQNTFLEEWLQYIQDIRNGTCEPQKKLA